MDAMEIALAWIADGRGNDCFWEGWECCPTPNDELTPNMILEYMRTLRQQNADMAAWINAQCGGV